MNLESCKVEFVGGPLDGEKLVMIDVNEVCVCDMKNGTSLVYNMIGSKYYFVGYIEKGND